jgi:hypothetical protein
MRQAHYAAAILVPAVVGELVWYLAPEPIMADVQLIARALLFNVFGVVIWRLARPLHWSLGGALAFCAVSLNSSAGCSIAWLIQPWQRAPDADTCSHFTQLPLLTIAGLFAVVVAWLIARDSENGR